MDDQAWAELEAETLGMAEPVAPSGDEPELSLQSDPSIPDTQETDSPETQDAVAEAETPTEAEAVAPEVHERIVALEQELAQHRAAKEAEQAALAEKIRQFQEQQQRQAEQADADEAAAFTQKLRDQGDHELADVYEQRRNWLVQSRYQALNEAEGNLRGLEALTMVLEDHLPEEQIRAIVQDAYQIAPLPTSQKQQWLQQRRQSKVQASTRELTLLRENQELRNRLAAQDRPIAADIVEGGRSGGGGSLNDRLDEAADFNDWFATFSGTGAA